MVVFDKVRENTAGLLGGARTTYSQAANLALNQTLVRSINTSIIALLPVAGILVVATALLGANNELEDLALVLFVGMLSGTYSSIFIATPVLADLKERQPQYQALAKRVAVRASGGRAAKRAAAKAEVAGRGPVRRHGRRAVARAARRGRAGPTSASPTRSTGSGAGRGRADHHRVARPGRAGQPRRAGHRPAWPAAAAAPQRRQYAPAPPGGQEEAALADDLHRPGPVMS